MCHQFRFICARCTLKTSAFKNQKMNVRWKFNMSAFIWCYLNLDEVSTTFARGEVGVGPVPIHSLHLPVSLKVSNPPFYAFVMKVELCFSVLHISKRMRVCVAVIHNRDTCPLGPVSHLANHNLQKKENGKVEVRQLFIFLTSPPLASPTSTAFLLLLPPHLLFLYSLLTIHFVNQAACSMHSSAQHVFEFRE